MNEMFGELFLPCEMPEPPKQGFFQSLFGNTSNLDREELCKFSAHLQWSWPAPATLAGNKIWSTSTMAPAYTSLWLDGTEVSASGWGSGGPGFQSHPRLTFQSCSRYQLNQLGSKAASESTFKKSNTCGVSNNRLDLTYCILCEQAGSH